MNFRRQPLFALLLIVPPSGAAQERVRVEFTSDPLRNTGVTAVERSGRVFVSLADLARVFSLRTYENYAAGKYEVKSGAYAVKVTAGNPYVIVRDQQLNASVYQFPAPAFRDGGHYFAPASAMAQLLDYILPGEVSWDKPGGKLLVTGGGSPLLSPYDVGGLEFEQKSNGYLIRLRCSRKISDYESWVKPAGEDSWLYITLADARADVKKLQSMPTPDFVRKVLVFQSATSVQLTFRMKGRVSASELLAAEGSDDILVTLHKPSSAPSMGTAPHASYEETVARERERWKLDVVVIDAGHGGDDPGTIGVTNVREKDVVLDIARKLGNLFKRNLPEVKVVQTRERDEFIEVYRRGQIANSNNGKLFISIHCNSMPRKPHATNGFEIYLLRPGKTDAAIRIAERENAVVQMEEGHAERYKELTEENFILLTMAQSAYMKFSEEFAEILQQEMGKHLSMENNGVRQAGFYVLVGASMPNVLVETGYLSNREDERLLKSESGKQRMAEAIFNAVRRYKTNYEKSLRGG